MDRAYETIDAMEQYSRRNNLRIYGVPESANELTDTVVMKICSEKLGVNVPFESIDCCHRLGKAENGTRPILIKFVSRNCKDKVYNNKKKLKGTKIIVREDLTKKKAALMKEVQKKCGTVWTNSCNIYTKIGGKIHRIMNGNDLKKICST